VGKFDFGEPSKVFAILVSSTFSLTKAFFG